MLSCGAQSTFAPAPCTRSRCFGSVEVPSPSRRARYIMRRRAGPECHRAASGGLLLRLIVVVSARRRQLIAVLQANEGLLAQLEHQRVIPAAVGLHVLSDSIVYFRDSVLFQH